MGQEEVCGLEWSQVSIQRREVRLTKTKILSPPATVRNLAQWLRNKLLERRSRSASSNLLIQRPSIFLHAMQLTFSTELRGPTLLAPLMI